MKSCGMRFVASGHSAFWKQERNEREGEREEGGIVVMKREREREDKRDWKRQDKGGER